VQGQNFRKRKKCNSKITKIGAFLKVSKMDRKKWSSALTGACIIKVVKTYFPLSLLVYFSTKSGLKHNFNFEKVLGQFFSIRLKCQDFDQQNAFAYFFYKNQSNTEVFPDRYSFFCNLTFFFRTFDI
jgi:hypothetical protein